MKTNTLILFMLMISLMARGSHVKSDLNLKLFNNMPVSVLLNGRPAGYPGTEFKATGLQPGEHRITVWKNNPSHYASSTLMYDGRIYLEPGTTTYAMIASNRTLRILNVFPKPLYASYNNCFEPVHNVPYGMHPEQFNNLKRTIASRSFDNTKVEIAKQALRTNSINSRQVAELLELLSFDSNKLELAKFAYRYAVDPGNYYLTYDAFTFDSSIRELNRFIERSA